MARPSPVLTVIGDLVEDVVVWSSAIEVGTDNPSTVHRSRGGSAANVAVAAAAAGAPTRFIGQVGDDDAGRRLVAELVGSGVQVRVQTDGTTGVVVVVVTPDGERTMFPDRGAAARLHTVDPAWLADTAILHLTAYSLADERTTEALCGAARAVRDSGGIVALDLSAASLIRATGAAGVRRLIERLGATLVFANREEASTAAIESGLAGLTVIIKDGPRPATVVRGDGERAAVPALDVDGVVDTTGAGDAFAGGFLAAWLVAPDPVSAAAAGHTSAAAVLATPGATTSRSC